MEEHAQTTIGAELEKAKLGDLRLSRRLGRMADQLMASPDKSFPKAFTEAELEGAYRFFSHEEVDAQAIVEAHAQGTEERVRSHEGCVLAVHDTTVMPFPGGVARTGLSPTRGKRSAPGFFAHVSLAVEPGEVRRPLGALALSTWVRAERKKRAGERRESARWLEQIERVETDLNKGNTLVHVMDRESDDYALFAQLDAKGVRFISRVRHNRKVLDRLGEAGKLLDQLPEIRCEVVREVKVSSRTPMPTPSQKRIHPAREARLARLAIGSVPLTLERPKRQARSRRGPEPTPLPERLTVSLVHVWEPNPPHPDTAIRWMLVTNEPIESTEDVLAVVDAYRARWTIEDYFKALKTGCAFLERQLESFHALTNCLALFLPIAYQLLRLRSEARAQENTPAEAVLHPVQLDVLKTFARKPLPAQPTVSDALYAIAGLGGHLKRNGHPGWQTLLRGYQELSVLIRGWVAGRAHRRTRRCDQ